MLVFLFSAIAGSTAAGSAPAACVSEATRERDGMRWAHRCVSTSDPRAQDAFDDGLTLLYAFNPTEARRAFQRAARADDGLALAWWGIAQTYAPNINGSYDSADARHGRDAIARAQSRVARATPVERALVEAARQRFAAVGSADGDRDARAYRDAMAHVADAHADDDDAAVLAAEAEMDVHPWSYFEPNGSPTAGTPGLIARLQSVLARTPEHIGAAHLTIHAYEESTHPNVPSPQPIGSQATASHPQPNTSRTCPRTPTCGSVRITRRATRMHARLPTTFTILQAGTKVTKIIFGTTASSASTHT